MKAVRRGEELKLDKRGEKEEEEARRQQGSEQSEFDF